MGQNRFPIDHSPLTSTGAGEGVNKVKVQKCWKRTDNISVGGGVNKMKVQECWKWTYNILVGEECHHFGSEQVFQPVQISRR